VAELPIGSLPTSTATGAAVAAQPLSDIEPPSNAESPSNPGR
jgi:hypothetical protein